MQHRAKLTSKCQITIPAAIRAQLGIGPGDRVILEVVEGRALLRPVRGSLTERMAGLGADLWRGLGEGWLDREREEWEPAP